jgi:hypothetical protein
MMQQGELEVVYENEKDLSGIDLNERAIEVELE